VYEKGRTDLLLLVGGEDGNLLLLNIGPLQELLFPLHDRDTKKKEGGTREKGK
jgi:hypothetical protein